MQTKRNIGIDLLKVEDCIYAYDCNITYARSWRCTG